MSVDLFGNLHPERVIRGELPARQLEFIDAAAERLALVSGRPKSQERAEIIAPLLEPADA